LKLCNVFIVFEGLAALYNLGISSIDMKGKQHLGHGRELKRLYRKKLLPFSQNCIHHINRLEFLKISSLRAICVYFNKLWDMLRICHFDVRAHERTIIVLAMYDTSYIICKNVQIFKKHVFQRL